MEENKCSCGADCDCNGHSCNCDAENCSCETCKTARDNAQDSE